MIQEREVRSASGYRMLFLLLATAVVSVLWLVHSAGHHPQWSGVIASLLLLIGSALLFGGLFVVNPNEARRRSAIWRPHTRTTRKRKAAMVSNLLVVLCSERHTQPVVNTGTIYH